MAIKNRSQALPNPSNLTFVENLYEDFLRDASSVPPDWQRYFAELGDGELRFRKAPFAPTFHSFSIFNPPSLPGIEARRPLAPSPAAALQDRVHMLIRLYRVRGHRIARVDPLGLPQSVPPELQ